MGDPVPGGRTNSVSVHTVGEVSLSCARTCTTHGSPVALSETPKIFPEFLCFDRDQVKFSVGIRCNATQTTQVRSGIHFVLFLAEFFDNLLGVQLGETCRLAENGVFLLAM